jgi:predicted nucleotidyltransferase
MKTLDEIKEILNKRKKELNKEYKVKEIGIFGSYMTGKHKGKSDFDILVDFEEVIDFFEFLELEERLTKILNSNFKVDLVMKKALKPNIGKYILSEAVYV